MIKVALIGAGMIATAAHIPAYRNHADIFSVEAVFDANPAVAAAVAEKHGIPHSYADIDQLFDEIQPDVVSVCVPNAFHKEYVKLGLECGAHVLCEKPLVASYRDAVELFTLAKTLGKHLITCQSMRYTPDRLAARAEIDNGLVGDVYYASMSRVRRRGIPTWGRFHMKKHSCGGAFVDIGVHILDAMLWLMGNPEISAVMGSAMQNHKDEIGSLKESGARTGKVDHARSFNPDEMDVEDFASGILYFKNGATAHICSAWAANMPESNDIRIIGKKAGIFLPSGEIYSGKDSNTLLTPKLDIYEKEAFPGHFHIIDNLVDVLLHDKSPDVLPEQTIQVSQVLDMFYRSAEEGRVITPVDF